MNNSHVEKICFVTVGATASFDDLIRAVIDRKFILELIKAGYTKIVVQYGKTGSALFHECQQKAGPVDIEIEGFDFKSGDFRDAVEVVTASDRRKEGVMIAHAGWSGCQSAERCANLVGTGSLLDGLHFQIPTVLVPNHSLADNHQEELAKKFAGMKLCIYGGFRFVNWTYW